KGVISQANGTVPDWKYDKDSEPVPEENFPREQVVERDYTKINEKNITRGENIRDHIEANRSKRHATEERDKLRKTLGKNKHLKYYNNLPSLKTDRKAAECILTLSSTTNGNVAMKAWKAQEENTGQELTEIAIGRSEEQITFNEITTQPRRVLSTP